MTTKNKSTKKNDNKAIQKIEHGALNDLSMSLTDAHGRGSATSITESTTGGYITLQEVFLLKQWAKKGLLRTFICLPVDDALKGGVKVTADNLDDDLSRKLEEVFLKKGAVHVKETGYWARHFGGAALLVLSDEEMNEPFNKDKLNQSISFMSVDRWRLSARAGYTKDFVEVALNKNMMSVSLEVAKGSSGIVNGKAIDNSRINIMMGDTAPFIIRQALAGWGLSSYEKVSENFDTYEKAMTLIHELLKEGKVNVIKVKGLINSLRGGEFDDIVKVFSAMTSLKKQINTMIIDAEDDYQQTQSSFTGFGEALKAIMTRVAADLRMPMTKLFGISAAGFNSGEDDIENYNAMVNSTVRPKLRPLIEEVLHILCVSELGIIPQNLSFNYLPLKEVKPKELEEINEKKFARYTELWEKGIISDEEYKEKLEREKLV